jgi:hypothetical protein
MTVARDPLLIAVPISDIGILQCDERGGPMLKHDSDLAETRTTFALLLC